VAGERKLTVTWDGKDVGLKRAADKAADDVADSGKRMSDSFEDAGDDSGGSFLDGIGGKIAAGIATVGIASAGLLAKGFADAMDLEVVTDKLSAQLGGGQFGEDMGKIAGDLYVAGFGESVADTGDALRRVWQNGLIPEDAVDADIERITGLVMTFADVMEQDLDMTTQAVKSMVRSGIADSTEEALDVMTRGIQQGADKAGDLAETFQEYSTNFAALGITGAEATGLMVQGLDAGARDADKVADAIKEFGIRAKDGSDLTREAFELLGIDAETAMANVAAGGDSAKQAFDDVLDALKQIEDPLERNNVATALFGTQSEDMQAALSNLDVSSAVDRLGEVEGATDDLNVAYDNASTKIESFKRGALMELTEFVGGTVIPGIENLVGILRDNLGPTFDTIKDTATEFWNALTTGFTEDEGTPIERVALAIRDAFGQLADAWNNDLKPALDELIANGREIAEEIDWHTVWRELIPLIEQVGQTIADTYVLIAAYIARWVETFNMAVDSIQHLWETNQTFRTIVTEVWDWVSAKITTGLQYISGVMKFWTAVLQGDWSAAWAAIKQVVSAAFGSIWADVQAATAPIRANLATLWNGLSGSLSSIVSQVESQLNRLISVYNNTVGRIPGVADIPSIGGPARNLATNRIPKFASGGLAFGPTLAVVGDNPGAATDPEVIAPLSRLRGMGIGGGGGVAQLEITSDGSEVGDLLLGLLRKSIRNRGGNLDVVFG